jgi:hypothetical protein
MTGHRLACRLVQWEVRSLDFFYSARPFNAHCRIARHIARHAFCYGVMKLESFGDYAPDPRHIQIGRR